MASLPTDPRAAYYVARVAHALECARRRSDPSQGALAGYVIVVDSDAGDDAIAAIPWQAGVYERILTDAGDLAAGWAPLELVASALSVWDEAVAEELRTSKGSDTSVWSVAFFGTNVASVRTRRVPGDAGDRSRSKRLQAGIADVEVHDDHDASCFTFHCGPSDCEHG